MSFPRLTRLSLLGVLCLPLFTAGCGLPLAVTAASYAADGASLAATNKSGTDHLVSMVSKKDCALWRWVKGKAACKEREDGRDPYDVDYTTPERVMSEDGMSWQAPPRPPADAPASSWDAAVYKQPATPAEPVTAVAETPVSEPTALVAETPPAEPTAAAKPAARKKGHAVRQTPKAKKLSQGRAAPRS